MAIAAVASEALPSEWGSTTMTASHADAPFLRRILAVLVLATVLSGAISGVGVLRLANANAGTASAACACDN